MNLALSESATLVSALAQFSAVNKLPVELDEAKRTLKSFAKEDYY